MLKTIIAHELQGVLYIMGACLLYLIIIPIFIHANYKQKFLFVMILIVLTYFYIGYEDIHPIVYTIHLAPVSIVLAALYEGIIPGVFTWAAFNLCSTIFLHNELLPTLVSSSIMMIVGLIFYYKKYFSFAHNFFASAILISIYLVIYLFLSPQLIHNHSAFLLYGIMGTYLSSWFVNYLYYQVKKQERLKEELINAEKYQLIGQLAASISHEIRNPLTTTRGFLQLMEKDHIKEEDRKRYINLAIHGIDHANKIITDYLNYAKPNVEKFEKIDINAEILTIIPLVTSLTALSNIEIKTIHMTLEQLYIYGESKKIQQCMLNLLKNAIEAMPGGGVLTIKTLRQETNIHVILEDTGVGMTHAQIKSLGLPFYSTKEKGTGLGLMVVTSLLKAMNAKISFFSKPNKGTTCLIEFKSAL